MAVYTFHLPRDAVRGDASALEQAVLVRDGFSWGALIFQVLWCLWNRLWLVALGFVLVSTAISVGLGRAGVSETAIGIAGVLLAILLGLEGGNLRRQALERRGFALRGVVVAPDRFEAERRAFSVWLSPEAGSAAVDIAAPASGDLSGHEGVREHGLPARDRATRAHNQSEVIGLFPAAEEPR